MALNSEILLLTKQPELQAEVSAALEPREEIFPPLAVCRDLISVLNRLEGREVPFVLIDSDSEFNGILEEIEPVANRFVHTRFIVLASELKNDLALKAMQSGIRHIQLKENMDSELCGVLERLLPDTSGMDLQLGSAITVLSAGGGCGATTLVVNLANELQLTSSKPVLIVDLDYSYGAVATYLELQGRYGVADVLSHTDKIDPQMIDTTAVEHSDHLHALVSPVSIDFNDNRSLKSEKLSSLVSACKQGHAYTLIDAPRVSMEVAATLAECSDVTLIVFQPMVKDIRVAKSMMSALKDQGVPNERIRPIINRYRKRREMVTFEEAKKVLGDGPLGRVTNDYASAVRGINFGKPLASSAPRSPLRKDMINLASEMSELKPKTNGSSGPVGN